MKLSQLPVQGQEWKLKTEIWDSHSLEVLVGLELSSVRLRKGITKSEEAWLVWLASRYLIPSIAGGLSSQWRSLGTEVSNRLDRRDRVTLSPRIESMLSSWSIDGMQRSRRPFRNVAMRNHRRRTTLFTTRYWKEGKETKITYIDPLLLSRNEKRRWWIKLIFKLFETVNILSFIGVELSPGVNNAVKPVSSSQFSSFIYLHLFYF